MPSMFDGIEITAGMTWPPPPATDPCPRCGRQVESWDMKAGAIYTIKYAGPGGRDGHVVARGADPVPDRYDSAQSWPDGDVFTVNPCGHEVTREELSALMTAAGS